MSVRKGASAYAVRILMTSDAVEAIADLAQRCPEDVAERVHDQLWLRSVLMEQRRRTRIAEREQFDTRANHILELLDPPDDSFDELARLAQVILDRHYPADIFNTANPIVGNDPGTRLVVALREVTAVRS